MIYSKMKVTKHDWNIFICVLLMDILSCVQGDCIHSGRSYMKHTVWQPGPCTVCTCEDPIVLCETIRCTDPQCDYNKGEYLQISADSCCPECVSQLSPCSYHDKTIPHNTDWNPEPCIHCRCDDGEVTCTKVPCTTSRCKAGEIIQNLPSHCCPKCIPAGRECTYDGKQYQDGSDWEPLPCTTCVCRDSQHTCYPRDCPLTVCTQNEVLEVAPETCCPTCQGDNTTCHEGSKEYKTGDQWHRNPCTVCVCIAGTVVCTQKECMDLLICNRDDEQATRPNECCPECVPKRGACMNLEPVRYSGDIWNISTCDYCTCNNGKVQCHKAACENTICLQEEVLVHLPGTCCPRCIIPPSCESAGQIHKDGERWYQDDCTVCYCDSGTSVCYQEPCPSCPEGSISVLIPGDCCGTCTHVSCSPECAACEPTARNNCTRCTNTRLFVQEGRCVHTCRMGFYPSPDHVCLPCHDSCYTCVDDTRYHCDMCQPGLMWKHGECVAQCGAAYYLQNGKCLQCHSSCKSCNGPRSDQCISCSNPAQVVFRGQCLDHCPDNFFIRGSNCIACHPTCKTCTSDGSGCATCWQGGLLHLGQCVTRCSIGFYANIHGSCSPCHPACEACSGGYNKNCTSCFTGGRLSKKNKCRSQCQRGQYFAVDGSCKVCQTGCAECHEAWSRGTSVCSACNNRDLVPSGGVCMEKCRPGQYQEYKVCKDCGENCLVCTSPSTCTKCAVGSILYDGLCVERCAQGQYEHMDTRTCKDCSSNCLRCYSLEECSICSSGTYLKLGHCVATCGDGFMPNPTTRECSRNTAAPTFKVLQHVKVPYNGLTHLRTSMFYVADPDTPSNQLIITVVTPPSNGDILMVREGEDVVVEKGGHFTVKDVADGRVRFRHHTGQDMKGKAVLRVTDSQLNSQTGDMFFQAVVKDSISIATKLPIFATKGETTVIKPDLLDLQVEGPADDISITVLQGPERGSLYNIRAGATVRMFSLADLRDGRIGYRHRPKAGLGPDTALLQASDGFNLLSFLLDIDVRTSENHGPVLMRNNIGHVVIGDMLQISPKMLLAKAADKPGPKEEVVYTLVPPLNNPQEGEIMMVVPIPSSGVGHGWEDLGDGNMAARMSRFLQRDIDEGRIWYKNKGSAALTDIVKFEVADTSSPANILPDQSLVITVRDKSSTVPAARPSLAPGVRLGIKVFEDQLVPITSTNLAFQDRDTVASDIIYHVTRPLSLRDGTVEHIEQPFHAVQTFTQDDVDNGRIIYRPPEREIGDRQKEAFFFFTVSDGENEEASEEYKFSIHLVPVNNMPPRFTSPIPVVHVSQGGSVPIGQTVLGVTDEDTPLSDLSVTLTREPHHGRLEKVQGSMKVTLQQGDIFTYTELEQGVFQYQHDGSAGLYDTLQLGITDGEHSSLASIDISVITVDRASPYMLPSASCRLTVTEGSSKTVQRNVFAFVDNDDTDDHLKIMLLSNTVHGKLLFRNKQVLARDVFTQGDLNGGYISFLADSEIGQKPVMEVLLFNVTDSSNNLLPSQTLTVLIEPDNNQPPRVKVITNVKVNEGGHVTLTSDHIVVTDPDTVQSKLVIVIETPPGFGGIKDIAPVPGSEKLEERLVTSFSVEDLVNKNIVYVQSDHEGKEPIRDSFLFHVTDGINRSPTTRLNINIVPVNDEAPRMVTEQVFVQEGQTVIITNASLYVTDIDTPSKNLTFTLVTPPSHGAMKKKETKYQSSDDASTLLEEAIFSYQDILAEMIVYVHDGSEVTMDSLSVSLSDGRFSVTGRVSVIVGLINDEVPRVTINTGLRVHSGSTTIIQKEVLRSTDVDSNNDRLVFTVTKDPQIGSLYITNKGKQSKVSTRGPVKTFTQKDINDGKVEYKHDRGETTGNIVFKFTVSDMEGNDLIDQDFYITILEDRYPPEEVSNRELIVEEDGQMVITTKYLSFTDTDSRTDSLQYTLVTAPQLGHLELTNHPGVPISQFSQSDLAASRVVYKHTSEKEVHLDSFQFSVTDGTNTARRTFSISISPVDDSLPVVTCEELRAQEGVRKIITEFDLKAEDKDTKEELLIFIIVQAPEHGQIEHFQNSEWVSTTSFSMTEIYENHVSYLHDGTDTVRDKFLFTVTDSTNKHFVILQNQGRRKLTVTENQPQEFQISIMALDDGSPIIQNNLGLQFLEVSGSKVTNIITSQELQATDTDTSPARLKYVVRVAPQHGRLEKTDKPGVEAGSFTQEHIDNGIIRYVLTDKGSSYEDSFTFDLYDSKPNRVPNNVFHITWSSVSFEQPLLNVTETAGAIRVTVKRRGNLKQYSIVTCRGVSGTATSSEQGSRPGQQDFVQHVGQVQFDEWQDTKTCTIIINDDSIFEGPETFYVELLQPMFTMLGGTPKTTVNIVDVEDEPVLQFKQPVYHVNESDSYLSAAIIRSGDFSSTVSTICFTTTLTARGSPLDRLDSGSDYISRGNSNSYRVVFPSGVTMATCDVKLIDDSIQESSEQFELELSLPSYGAKLGPLSRATVVIDGPNDESLIHFSQSEYYFTEDAGTVSLEIVRRGTDLSHSSTVWCATRLSQPPSASSGQDYVPSSSQITFGPGQTTQLCHLTLLDDDLDPRMEGNETFGVFLSSAISSSLVPPFLATVTIGDQQLDVPTLSFEQEEYHIDEGSQGLQVPIYRSGDPSYEASVICYTRQSSALVSEDFGERMLAEGSRIVFHPGEKVKNCSVTIIDDDVYEDDEDFYLKLARPQGSEESEARLGDINSTKITVTNVDDIPTVQFERSAYSIPEPSSKDLIAVVTIHVVRLGDVSKPASVRCSTRDGSASSGTDYNPRSQMLEFETGARSIDFPIDILYNSNIEWHETFSVVLGPGEPEGVELGAVPMATITILDNDVSGSLVLPAPPMIVSLLKYDDAETGAKVNPSPGYPLICITPCDTHHPSYTVTHTLCTESKVNQSAMYYRWEVALPDTAGTRSPFVEIAYSTLFTSVNNMVLDSIYFRPSFKIRCIAQPIDEKGNLGIPLKSNPVTIGRDNGICKAPVFSGLPYSYQAQSFLATLEYVGTEDKDHPNTIHISVEVPHQDGMLPLISTFPIHNLKYVLSERVYRQQHICSNIILPKERASLLDSGFLENTTYPESITAGFDFPYQFDDSLRERRSLLLYQHLNLKSCVWKFNAWYHMTDLVDMCGGRVSSDFQTKDNGQTYLTVRVPLHVSYLYAAAPIGWGSLEHRTEMEFSFYYDTVLWRSGLETNGDLGGKLQVTRILIGDDGKLVVDFRTQAKFRGLYVENHYTLPGYSSRFVSEDNGIMFKMALLWGQPSFDGPFQFWRATSEYSLKDYTGEYLVELLPCTVQANQGYTIQTPVPCTAHTPQRFKVPIAFQQTNRPVPLEYTLNTHFELSKNDQLFLENPFTTDIKQPFTDMDTQVTFSKGDRLYGRVLWSPEQDLKSAYTLVLEKVFICAGRDGYIPTYDPNGSVYNSGKQFGCIQPGRNLRYRFLILDRGAPDIINTNFQSVPFEAEFVYQNPLYSSMMAMNGMDGFVMNVDPLYKVVSGYQWYIQVIYSIGPSDPTSQQYRTKRSTLLSLDRIRRNAAHYIDQQFDWLENNKSKNGTNIQVLYLNQTEVSSKLEESGGTLNTTAIVLLILLAVMILIGAVLIYFIFRRKKRHKKNTPRKKNNLEIAKQNSVIYKGRPNNIVRCSAAGQVEMKETKIFKGDRGKPLVRVKDTNIQTDKNISKGNGTEV